MPKFIDFNNEIGNLRFRMCREIEKLFIEKCVQPPMFPFVINTEDVDLSLAGNDEVEEVTLIKFQICNNNFFSIQVETDHENSYSFSDLGTDDMESIYHCVYTKLYE